MTEAFGAIVAVLVASVLGSLHCAGMCGGLVLFAVGSDGALERRGALHVAYHGARGVAYTVLGLAAGAVGAGVDVAPVFGEGARTSAVVAGGLIVALGLVSLARCMGAGVKLPRLPKRMQMLAEGAHRRAFMLPPVHRAAAVGLLTPLLPCGWLYAFVIVAAGTGSILLGGAVMAAFWLGTVPVLAAVGVGLQRLSAPLRKRLPMLTSVVVVGLGVMTAMGRVSVPSLAAPNIEGDTLDERVEAAGAISHEQLPCCNGGVEPPG